MNTSKLAQFKDAWKFSAKEKEWEKLGTLVSPIVLQLIEQSYTSCTRSPFVHRGNCLAHLDLLKNKYSYYEDEFFETIDRIISHPNTDELLLVRRASRNQRIYCHISSVDELLSDPIEKGVLYEVPVVKESTLGILPWLLLLPGSLLIYFTLLKLSSFKVVHKSHLQNEKSIPPNFFSPLEKEILLLLLEKESGFLVSDLNHYFDEEFLSYPALKKRRETFIRYLRTKLSDVSDLNQLEVLIEVKSEKDRRLKIISLHPELREKLLRHF